MSSGWGSGDFRVATPTRLRSQMSQGLLSFSFKSAGITRSILCSDMSPDELTRNVENPSINTLQYTKVQYHKKITIVA